MTHRFNAVVFSSALFCASWFAPVAQGQQAAPAAGSVQEELRALRQLIEQQSKQIDTLTAQVTRLGSEMERRGQVPPAPSSAVKPEETTPAPAPAPGAAPAAKVVPPNGEAPASVHIVVKGDSLEKIAKLHSTTIAELIKLNKISDPKKLQIGQQITLPAPATPAPTPQPTQPEKKEGQ
jgi:LysM repeat protein